MFDYNRNRKVADRVQVLLYQINTECNAIKQKLEYLSRGVDNQQTLQKLKEIHTQVVYINRQLEAPQEERETCAPKREIDWYSFIDSFWSSD